jgi:protein-disulfide isomerase
MSENTLPPQVPMATKLSTLGVPVAIVLGFALVAAAIYFSGIGAPVAAPVQKEAEKAKIVVAPVTKDDYIRGNPNAPIKIVEYSDFDCPFCKNFHETMTKIMEDYGVSGKVAWVYRQYPIPQLHPNAPRLSEAALCVGELGGNDAFWKFADEVFGSREVNEKTNMTLVPSFAEKAGVKRADFNTCLDSGRHTKDVQDSLAAGVAAGTQGTPHSIILVGNQQAVIDGAQPYQVVKQMLDNLISQLDGSSTEKAN